jgi:SRSO17 transposase
MYARTVRQFRRREARERAQRYLAGPLGRSERKNGWQLAEALGEGGPQGMQRLLNAADWNAEAVRDALCHYVVEHLADEANGVPVIDDTGEALLGTGAAILRARLLLPVHRLRCRRLELPHPDA